MNVATGKFENRMKHHAGYFRVFRFYHGVEIWFGSRWITINL